MEFQKNGNSKKDCKGWIAMIFIANFLELSSMIFSYMALGAGIIIAPYVIYDFVSYIIVKFKLLKSKINKEINKNGI